MFWEGDRAQALKLSRLLADLEPAHSTQADILFVCRFDSKQDPQTVAYVSRKFNVFTHTSKRRGTGWPNGCNSLFFGAMEWVYHKMASAQALHYKAVLILGADGVPLRRDWLTVFHEGWKAAQPCFLAGAWLPDASGGGHDHINGDCALFSGDLKFLHWLAVKVGDVSVSAGWDWILSESFKQWGWANFPFVKSAWNRREAFTEENWTQEIEAGTVWFHGQKNDDLLDMARKKLV